MKQSIINKALEVIRERKREREFLHDKRLAPLYENENYLALHKEFTRLSIENQRKSIQGEKPDFESEKPLKNQMKEIEKSLGLDNSKTDYACKTCNDSGFVGNDFCKCLKQEISKVLLDGSGFEKLQKFDDAIKTSGALSPLYQKMQQWCASDFKKDLIYLAGPTGVGKTYLMQCMADALIERGLVTKIVTAFKLNQDFKEFSRKHEEDLLNKYIDCEVLFIDDIGTEPLYRNVTIEYLYLIINERKMKKLPTIITSNLLLSDIFDRYDERIFSRIADKNSSVAILMQGEDKRINKK